MRRWRPGAVDADPELIVLTVLAVLLYVGAARRRAGCYPRLRHRTAHAGRRALALAAGQPGWGGGCTGRLPAGLARHRPRGCVGGGSLSRRQRFAAVPPHHCERKGKVMATRETGFGGAPALCPPTTATLPEALSVAFSKRDACDIRRSAWLRDRGRVGRRAYGSGRSVRQHADGGDRTHGVVRRSGLLGRFPDRCGRSI
jgi:hypothetical protein